MGRVTGGEKRASGGPLRRRRAAQRDAHGAGNASESVRIRITSGEGGLLERAAAEAYEAGATGALETTDALELFVPLAVVGKVLESVAPFAVEGLAIAAPVPEPPIDWSEVWRHGLGPVLISPRLMVRPPFAEAPATFSGFELVIEPGQAFGTGGHATTRLALAGLDELPDSALRGAHVLDVGCGSGVLALAALALGAARATGCDLDPLATGAAKAAAEANGLAVGAAWVTGGPAALAGRYDGIVANLIRSEMAPLLEEFRRLTKPGGWLVAAGLLAGERQGIRNLLAAAGFRVTSERQETDPTGDAWLGLTATRV